MNTFELPTSLAGPHPTAGINPPTDSAHPYMSRPLRILVAQNVVHNRRGGMSRMLGFIHDRVERDGHTVEYFAADQVPPRLGGRLARFSFPLLLLRHARRAARAGRPYDVINVHEPSAAAVAVFKRRAGNPFVVVTSHGVEDRGWEVAKEDARLGRDRVRWKTRLIFPPSVLWPSRVGLRRADHVFCLNTEDVVYLEKEYGLPPERITRLFPAADPAYTAAFPRRDYAAPADRLLWFGTWLTRKGVPDLVEAFAALVPKFPNLALTVMGAGVPPEAVRGSFPEALCGRVECVPPGTEQELAERMLGAAVYVIPSLFEGTPQTLPEAMATGMPAVGTATCGMKDVIRDGENGLLVAVRRPGELAAAITRLLADRALRERTGRQAHADVVANYTWDQVAEPVRAVYRRLAEQRYGKG